MKTFLNQMLNKMNEVNKQKQKIEIFLCDLSLNIINIEIFF